MLLVKSIYKLCRYQNCVDKVLLIEYMRRVLGSSDRNRKFGKVFRYQEGCAQSVEKPHRAGAVHMSCLRY